MLNPIPYLSLSELYQEQAEGLKFLEINKFQQAKGIFLSSLQEDLELAWGYHCNIAMGLFGDKIDHKTANILAAQIMERLFDVNITKFKKYGDIMNKDEQEIEDEIQDKNLNAPRLSPERIDAVIMDEDYYVFPGTTLTMCCLKLKNGFTVTGESAAASPENFDAELGRKIARTHAREKIWALEGYLLCENLSKGK